MDGYSKVARWRLIRLRDGGKDVEKEKPRSNFLNLRSKWTIGQQPEVSKRPEGRISVVDAVVVVIIVVVFVVIVVIDTFVVVIVVVSVASDCDALTKVSFRLDKALKTRNPMFPHLDTKNLDGKWNQMTTTDDDNGDDDNDDDDDFEENLTKGGSNNLG